MVRKYKKKTDNGSWDEASMASAIMAIVNGKFTCEGAAQRFDVPRTTLRRRLKKFQDSGDLLLSANKSLVGHTTVFDSRQERDLVSYVKFFEHYFHGLTTQELQALAFQLANKNNIDHPFKGGIAGLDWYRGFMSRHPDLSLRKSRVNSTARARGFNKVSVGKFFKLLEHVITLHNIPAERIYNVDETGCTIGPNFQSKIVATKERKQVAKKGQTVTVELCFSAAGSYMPPMFIFPRRRMVDAWLNGAPANSSAACHPSGWMQSCIFFNWFQRFVDFSQATKEKPVLLLLDGDAAHRKNIEVIDYARGNGVILLCFPPYCTRQLQPLDVSLMRTISMNYTDEVQKWMQEHPGRCVPHDQVPALFGNAFTKAATVSTALNGFQKTGISPFNPNVFTDADYAGTVVTDILLESSDEECEDEEDRMVASRVEPSQAFCDSMEAGCSMQSGNQKCNSPSHGRTVSTDGDDSDYE